MTDSRLADSSLEATAALAGALLSVDPRGLGGAVLLRPTHHGARSWSAKVRALMGDDVPLRRLPVNATDDRVLGGLDLAATLSSGRRVVMRGILAESDGGVIVIPLAERTLPGTVSALAEALDSGEVIVERDGVAARHDARITLVALDETSEGIGDLHVAPPLADRLAFQLAIPPHAIAAEDWANSVDVEAARLLLPEVRSGEGAVRTLCGVSSALGVSSLRAVVLAMRCARAHAALCGRRELSDDDVAVATQLVLAPRATCVPAPDESEAPNESPPPPTPESDDSTSEHEGEASHDGIPEEILLAAVRSMLPPDVLNASNAAAKRRAQAAGRRGRESSGGERGRQMRAAPGRLASGKKLDPVATLRAAAPWQAFRQRERATRTQTTRIDAQVIDVRRDDFRIRRYKRQSGTTTIIAVDASGSMAMQRLAEAKGAVELLLAQTYVRRDRVALIGFRGDKATLLLPPTRALARAKRVMAALPGGGGTPLASALELVHASAMASLRDGHDVVMVLLTDARANIARDGSAGRAKAMDDARRAARALRGLMQTTVMIDTSPRGETQAKEIAGLMGAKYVPLPAAQAREVANAVRAERAS